MLAWNSIIERYRPVLAAFLPTTADEEEERLRCGILYLRDRATAGILHATPDAARVLAVIERLGLDHAYAAVPADELATLHRCLVRLMFVARALETDGPGRRIDG